MSNETPVTYFTCPEFKVTMPVSDCKRRRRIASGNTKGLDAPGDGVKNSFMTRRCGQCTVYREAIAASISEQERMSQIDENPSQVPSEKAAARGSSSYVHMLTPYTHTADRRRFPQ